MAERISIRLAVEGEEAAKAFEQFARSGETSVSRIKLALSDLQDTGARTRVSVEQIDPGSDKLSRQLASLRTRYDEVYRAETQFARAQGTIDRAIEAQLIPMAEGGRLLQLVAAGHRGVASAIDKSAGSLGIEAEALERNARAWAAYNAKFAVQKQVNTTLGVRSEYGDQRRGVADFGTQARSVEIAAYGVELDKVRARFNPLFAAQQQYRTELTEINQALRTGAINEAEHAAAVTRKKTAFAEQVREMTGAAAQARALAASDAELQRQAQGLRDKIDPLAAAQREYSAAVEVANRAQRAGFLTAGQHAAALGLAKSNLDRATAASNENSKALVRGTASAGQMRASLINLGQQAQDVVVSLQGGQRPLTVLLQQGSQIATVFAATPGGATGVMKAAGGAILGLVTPATAALAALIALGSGVGLLISRAGATEDRLRSFDVILTGMGTRSRVTAAGLDEVVRGLRDTGTSADDALKAVQAFARVPGVNPAAARTLVPLARDISAATGEDLSGVATRIAQAFGESTDAAIKLTYALGGPNALTAAEVKSMQAMAAHGDRAGALGIAIEALQRRFGGGFDRSLSDSAKAVNSMSSAWNNMLDALSKTTAIEAARSAVIGMLNGITRAAAASNPTTPVDTANAARRSLGVPSLTPQQEQNLQNEARGQNNVSGGALSKSTKDRNLDLIERYESGGRNVHQQLVSPTVSSAQGYFQITNSTWRDIAPSAGIDLSTYPTAMWAPYSVQRNAASALYDKRGISPWAPYNSNLRNALGPVPASYGTGVLSGREQTKADASTVPSGLSEQQKSALQDQAAYNKELEKTAGLFGESRVYGQAYWQALGAGTKDETDYAKAKQAAEHAVAEWRIELGKSAGTARIASDLALAEAKAYGTDLVAGYRAAAHARAELAVRQGEALDVASKTQEILDTEAVAAIRAGREQTAAAQPRLASEARLLDAALKGTAAVRDQELQNEAAARTQEALAKAEASRNPVLIAQAKALEDTALAQEKYRKAIEEGLAAAASANNNRLTLQGMQLETGLVRGGISSEELHRQLSYLDIRQAVETRFANADWDENAKKARDAYVETAKAVADARFELTQAQREQERWNDLVRGLASTIDNELSRSIENAFDPERVESWGKRINRWLGTATTQLSSSLFIKPTLGTLAGALGFGSVATSLGTFSGTSGGGGSMAATKNSDGTITLSDVSSTASLGKSLFGDSGGMFGSGWFSNIGSSLGFGTSAPALSTSEVSSLGSLIGIEPSSLSYLGSAGTIPGSVFGSTTLGGFLGGAGAGFGAGSLLNSLLGGNKLYGTVGSGVGSLAGAAIGSLVPGVGTLVGGLVGGGLGGLTGLFGSKKPSNNATGLSIDLATGSVSGFASSGNKENDRDAREIRDSLTDFTKSIQSVSGGTVGGYINPQVGTRDGIKLDYDIPGYGKGTYTAEDAQDAIDKAELAIARGLTGISDTMKTVIDQITDPADLDAAIKFADTYDKISDAAKDAFSSIPSDLDIAGPFEEARDSIKTTFDDIAADAKEFSLSLQPITDALDEATERLRQDFNRYVTDLTKAIDDPLQSAVDIAKRNGDQLVSDAEAVGGNVVAVNRYNAKVLDGIWKESSANLRDLADELRYGESSGLNSAKRLAHANENYGGILADVRAGKTGRFDDLVTAARDLYSLSDTAYGQGPKTVSTREQLIADLDAVLASRAFAAGTAATPPGMILVGEQGRELISQPGGLRVYSNEQTERILAGSVVPPARMFAAGTESAPQWPRWSSPASQLGDTDKILAALADVLTELRANTGTARQGHYETVQKLDAQLGALRRSAPYEPARRKVA